MALELRAAAALLLVAAFEEDAPPLVMFAEGDDEAKGFEVAEEDSADSSSACSDIELSSETLDISAEVTATVYCDSRLWLL